MGVKCPKKTNRWLHLGRLLNWLVKYRVPLLRHVADKQPAAAPDELWWTITFGIRPAIARIDITWTILQRHETVLEEQHHALAELVGALSVMLSVKRVAGDRSYEDEGLYPGSYVIDGELWVLISDVMLHLEDQRLAAQTMVQSLSNDDQTTALVEIAKYFMLIINGVEAIEAERDGANQPARVLAPPVLPSSIAKMRISVFIREVLNPYRDRLHQFWSPAKIEQIEEEHKQLFTAYRDDTNFRAKLDKHTHTTGFNAGWSAIDNNGRKFATICSFMANLAVVFANTASVEGDFSILKGEKDEFRTSLGHLALEGIFQAKQFEQIRKLYSLRHPSASA
ncbi:hypothetical protein AC1031_006901 [Aphanomyces cochlioides]|nr:hypothetical protein AC1031_006901 [Aphanomyces cochlioides]